MKFLELSSSASTEKATVYLLLVPPLSDDRDDTTSTATTTPAHVSFPCCWLLIDPILYLSLSLSAFLLRPRVLSSVS